MWLTGLPTAGKTTLANAIFKELSEKYHLPIERLDRDVVRKTICKDLGLSVEDRQKNIERVTYLAKLLNKHGIIAITSFISSQREVKNWARKQIGNFIEVYVKCPLKICIKRDNKGNYKKALAGQISQFTGISQPYQEPGHPEIIIETNKENLEQNCQKVIKFLKKLNYLG